jgi:hypothetical protein
VQARLDRLEGSLEHLISTFNDAATRQPAPAPAPQPTPDANALLSELAANPDTVIRRIAGEAVQRAVQEAVAPALTQVIDTAGQQLLERHAVQIDSKFGGGTWDEVFRPQLEQDIRTLRQANPRAVADSATVQALVDRVYGPNYDRLSEKASKHTETMRAQEQAGIKKIVSALPIGGVPRLRQQGSETLPDDAEEFFKSVERTTGERIDRKAFAKVYNAPAKNGRTTLEDYLAATGAKVS